VLAVSEPYPQPDQATWRTTPVRVDPYRTEYTPHQPPRSRPPADKRTWLIRAGGLAGVAVVSGLVFLAFQPTVVVPGTAEPRPGAVTSAGKFTFNRIAGPAVDADCAQHAYSATQHFLQQHPCQGLTRSLYSTTTSDGLRAIVSVAVVTMPNAKDATDLQALTKKDGTGNISDLITDGTAVPNGPTSKDMVNGGFASAVSGDNTTITLSAFVGGHEDKDLLRQISTDALRLSAK
jgi:hypothetical protein